ncbi:MAG: hypothetical protein KDI68_03905 [Gammaproteobacteria bacterium]|nr:hypothetical protein [Gammaproteobacteria bacterium]
MQRTINTLASRLCADAEEHVIEGMDTWGGLIGDLIQSNCSENKEHRDCESLLTRGARDILHDLKLHPEFHAALETAITCNRQQTGSWHWCLLSNTPLLRIGLITVYRDTPIPAHDHPNSFGIQLVITGRARVRQYQPIEPMDRKHHLVSLEKISDSELGVHRSSVFTPEHRNIHEIEAVSPRTVLLSIMIHPYDPQERSWFFPTTIADTVSPRLFSRIRKRADGGPASHH